MKVFYDGYIYSLQSGGGINRYFASLIDRLPAEIEPTLITTERRSLNFPSNPRLNIKTHKRFAFKPGRLAYWLEKQLFRFEFNRNKPDIFHPSYYINLLQTPLSSIKVPKVLTVYDCIYENFPKLDPNKTERSIKEKAIKSADLILAISHSTKNDLQKFYDIDEQKITVQHLASDMLPKTVENANAEPYFIFVGNRWSYKNFNLAAQAVRQLREKHGEILLLTIGPPFSNEEMKEYPENWIKSLGQIDDHSLAGLYSGATALLYPSLYEGFGLPLLEAMRCGCPVICSNSSSMPEVAADAAILFEPNSLDSLTDAANKLLLDSSLRELLIERGYLRAKQFSWELAAEILVESYRSLC